MATPTITPGLIRTGPGLIYYAPLGTAIPTLTAAASLISGTWTAWLQVGATEDGLTFSTSTSTEDIRVAESQNVIRTVTTEKTSTVAFNMAYMSDLHWKLAENGGTIVTTGTGATKLNTYVPPLLGSEVRQMLGFVSLDNDEAFVWPQVFNGGGFETARAAIATKHGLPVTFNVELPDPGVLTTPYKRWVTGALAASV